MELKRFVEIIHTFDWRYYERHGIQPPRLTASNYSSIAKKIVDQYGSPAADEDPDAAIEREKFTIRFQAGRGCGLSTAEWVSISRRLDHPLRPLVLGHERVHGHFKRQGVEDYVESDVWLGTPFVLLYRQMRLRYACGNHPKLPDWFCRLAILVDPCDPDFAFDNPE